jgi:predicted AAA+ superfamily ATPase
MGVIEFIDPRFLPHNSHLDSVQTFQEKDPQLRRLKSQVYIHRSILINLFPIKIPGIYTLGGGRQIGKTTLLKQWMAYLLDQGVPPSAILFLSGELIGDHQSFWHILQSHLLLLPENHLLFVIVDEVTDISQWDKTVKYAADSGLLDNVVLMITSSDLSMLQEARMKFPGRRGMASQVDFHLFPLSFREFVLLKEPGTHPSIDTLYNLFDTYLIHGGYLTAVNDLARNGHISPATLTTYSDWIRGDALKKGKQEYFLKSFLEAVLRCYGTQVSWTSLAHHLPLSHPQTVAEYASLLESMDALYIQSALREDKLTAAPKKAKKLLFNDPFIFHAIRAWLTPSQDPFRTQIQQALSDSVMVSHLVESCAVNHYQRFFPPVYYLKGEGEVDIAYINKGQFWPVEIKWTNQIRPQDLRQVKKYTYGKILTRTKITGTIQSLPTIPLPLALFEMEDCCEKM